MGAFYRDGFAAATAVPPVGMKSTVFALLDAGDADIGQTMKQAFEGQTVTPSPALKADLFAHPIVPEAATNSGGSHTAKWVALGVAALVGAVIYFWPADETMPTPAPPKQELVAPVVDEMPAEVEVHTPVEVAQPEVKSVAPVEVVPEAPAPEIIEAPVTPVAVEPEELEPAVEQVMEVEEELPVELPEEVAEPVEEQPVETPEPEGEVKQLWLKKKDLK